MAILTYKPGLSLMLAHEGGYVNHPRDPGGATNRGVTQRVYDAYRRTKGLPVRSVRLIEDAEVNAIYKVNYWDLVQGDIMPAGLDYALFDFAVNSGVSRAVKTLQAGLGFSGEDVDGQIGFLTKARIFEAAKNNEEELVIRLCEDRMKFLRRLNTFDVFGKGWTRRVVGNQEGAQPDKDKGVIDYAVAFARRDPIFEMPKPIGTVNGEVSGKGFVPANQNEPMDYSAAVMNGWGL